ncbi:MAG: quercetin 2,3-dioxygenase, partial [Actinomycetota bacterium]|nr:quercetin 2,3-dioxygenase [Actinomycetota bacterium]
MPAVTADTLTLPRLSPPGPTDIERSVRSVHTGPRGYEGEGFPVVRAFAGVSAADL